MIAQSIIATILPLLSACAFASCAVDDHPRGPIEGGVVVETDEADYELVARPDSLRLYVRGHGTRIDLLLLDARIALVTGKSKQVMVLRPTLDRLEARGSFPIGPGTKAVATVSGPSQPATKVRFTLR